MNSIPLRQEKVDHSRWWCACTGRLHDGSVPQPTRFHDVRIDCRHDPPAVELLIMPHLQSAHRLERTNGAAITEGQFCNLTFWRRCPLMPCFSTGTLNICDALAQ